MPAEMNEQTLPAPAELPQEIDSLDLPEGDENSVIKSASKTVQSLPKIDQAGAGL